MLRRSGPDPRRSKLPKAAVAAATVAFGWFALSASAAASSPSGDDAAAGDGHVSVIEVSGLLDDVLMDFVDTQITDAEDSGALSLVLQLNSSGAVVDDDDFDALLDRV